MQYYHWNKEKQDEQRERHRNSRKEWYHNLATDGYSKERVLEEIEKCELLCANCHRKVTYDVI